ncbi:CHAP domain-containing protein [Micromonospora sp. URMC 105]|uniref:CHAP domain-containing protein n=1 Tax=Micromonospora sp. URMC 105 TaxID=3423413 RepID=UPI003F1B529E
MRKAIRAALVAAVAAASVTFIGTGTAHAAGDTQLGIDVGNIAWEQYTSTSTTVSVRRSEAGNEDCNYYTGFWTDPDNDRRTSHFSAACSPAKTTSGTMYSGGVKQSKPVSWRSRAWCADFAKYAFYWGTAEYSGLTPHSSSFITYGNNNGTWHSRSSGYTPRKGDAVVFNYNGGETDHVAIVTSYYADTVAKGYFYVVGGNQSDGVTHVKWYPSNTSIVGYASPAAK